jgi:hypothetical protein
MRKSNGTKDQNQIDFWKVTTTHKIHIVANGKNRKLRIFQLEEGDQISRRNELVKSYIMNYYKILFGPSDSGQFSLDNDRQSDILQILRDDNEKLTTVFIEQEVK